MNQENRKWYTKANGSYRDMSEEYWWTRKILILRMAFLGTPPKAMSWADMLNLMELKLGPKEGGPDVVEKIVKVLLEQNTIRVMGNSRIRGPLFTSTELNGW